jgi:hypothetical protein
VRRRRCWRCPARHSWSSSFTPLRRERSPGMPLFATTACSDARKGNLVLCALAGESEALARDGIGGRSIFRSLSGASIWLTAPRPVALAAVGAAASTGVVLAGDWVGTVPGQRIPDWLVLPRLTRMASTTTSPWPGLVLLLAVMVLVSVWLLLVRRVRTNEFRSHIIWLVATAWAIPLIVGPPQLSNDVFTFAAHGTLQLHHLNPYRHTPSSLGTGAALSAVDPTWRGAHSPYGPVATGIEHVAAWMAGGDVTLTVALLRLLAVAAWGTIGLLAVALAPHELRTSALTLSVANPLLLLHGLSAVHWEVLLGALVLGSLVLVQAGRWILGLTLACVAAAAKAPALLVVLVLVLEPAMSPRESDATARWRDAGVRAGVSAVSLGLLGLLVPDGWGWIRALATPLTIHTPMAPMQALADVFGWSLRLVHAQESDLTTFFRWLGAGTAALLSAYLLRTMSRRTRAATTGLVLLTAALLGPVLYPWYFLWGVLCLAPTVQGDARTRVVLLCVVATLMNIPGVSTWSVLIVAAVSCTVLVWAVARGLVVPWLRIISD